MIEQAAVGTQQLTVVGTIGLIIAFAFVIKALKLTDNQEPIK